VLDTNCDPDEVDFPIPGNDDAIRSVALLTRVIADAVAAGLMARAGGAVADSPAAEEPLADWERELLAGSEAPEVVEVVEVVEEPAAAAEPVAEVAEVVEVVEVVEEPAAAAAPVAEAVVETVVEPTE